MIALLGSWQARRDLNPQPSVLETDALPIELLAYLALKHIVSNNPTAKSNQNFQLFQKDRAGLPGDDNQFLAPLRHPV